MDIVLKLNNIKSRILINGYTFCQKSSDIIVVLTGSPGIVNFYKDFSTLLHASTEIPVCVVGLAGHEVFADDKSNILKNRENLFNLSGQIEHKLDLINNYIDKDTKLHLVGHSIGAWILLELLDKNRVLIERVASVQLLFPALQKLAQTRECKDKQSLTFNLGMSLLKILHCFMPTFVTKTMIHQVVRIRNWPLCSIEPVSKFIHPKAIEKVLFLLKDEIDKVTELNVGIIDRVKHITNVLYGNADGWVPLRYMDDLKQFQPSIQLTATDADHSFVLDSSDCTYVSKIVSNFIKTKKASS